MSKNQPKKSRSRPAAKPAPVLAGKVALVTGSEQGIGRGIAIGLAEAGARVVINYVWSRQRAEETADAVTQAGSEAMIVKGDVSKLADCRKLIRAGITQWGRLDILVNNAGRHIYQPLDEVTEEAWDTQLNTNVKGAFLLSQLAARHWTKTLEAGSILNITSCGSQRPFPGSAAYNASKGALLMLTRQLALELGPTGIRVNAIAPGVTLTPLSESFLGKADVRQAWEACIPSRRIGHPHDLAGAAVFLCSEAASYINGQQLNVDGAWDITLAWASV